jgi:polysaccharide biosynthesis/export protein
MRNFKMPLGLVLTGVMLAPTGLVQAQVNGNLPNLNPTAATPLPPNRPNLTNRATPPNRPNPQVTPITQPMQTDMGYRLGAGDQVDINVYDTPEVSGVKVVAPDGSITLPFVGKIQVAGLTADTLAAGLRQRLMEWYKNPVVAVTTTQFRPLRISVGGEVRSPGPLQMRNVPYDNSRNGEVTVANPTLPTLSSAIVAAGGVTRDGDIGRVVIRRNGVNQSVDLWQGLSSESAPQDILLQDGDSIYVPKLVAGSVIDPRLVAKSTLAPKTVRVRVVGEVKKPGEVDVPPSSTISSAIAIAGGPTEKSRMEEVRLVRLNPDGQVSEQKMNLQQLQDNQQVLDGDVVVVPKSRTSNFIDLAGQIISPLGVILNLFKGGN